MIRPIESIVFASLACAFLAPAAHPEESAVKRRVIARIHIAYGDLNLQNEADARLMLDRLKRAAYRACGGNPRSHPSYEVMPGYTVEVFRECREDAISAAVASVNSPTLTRVLAETRQEPRE